MKHRYSEAERRSALNRMQSGCHPDEVARELGIPRSTARFWAAKIEAPLEPVAPKETAALQQSVLAYLATVPAGQWTTIESVFAVVSDQPTRSQKSSVRRTVTALIGNGLVEHEKGSHELRLAPSEQATRCEVCDGPIQANNKTGLCRKTVECRRERDRRRSATKPGVEKTVYNFRRKMLYSARFRARKYGIPFDITMDDIPEIPQRCPLLGIPLVIWQGRDEYRAGTPSLDKIDPSLGYVKGNLWIISTRANQIKNDATPDELVKVALGVQEEIARRANLRCGKSLGRREDCGQEGAAEPDRRARR